MFQSKQDIALHLSLDGVQLIVQRMHSMMLVILINLNLPPEIRYKLTNIMTFGIFPGPSEPKDLNSFLRPFVDELDAFGVVLELRELAVQVALLRDQAIQLDIQRGQLAVTV